MVDYSVAFTIPLLGKQFNSEIDEGRMVRGIDSNLQRTFATVGNIAAVKIEFRTCHNLEHRYLHYCILFAHSMPKNNKNYGKTIMIAIKKNVCKELKQKTR